MNKPWEAAEEARLLERPYDYTYFNLDNPNGRTRKAFQIKRGMMGITGADAVSARPMIERNDSVVWNKAGDETVTWRDYLVPVAVAQAFRERNSKSQDYAAITVPTERPMPLAFVSDWHIGSWGVKAEDIARGTDRLLRFHQDYGLRIAILGDMLEMAIRLRSVAEVQGNILSSGDQIRFFQSWLREVAPLALWSTWDNHSVQREEELVGFSTLAEVCADHTIYHSGLGHTDLTVGDQVYQLATSHRFPGRSLSNPVMGQMRYMQREDQNCEVVVGGDSHLPAIMQYTEGGKIRTAANCGSLQLNSRFAKRYFSLHTSDAMPVVLLSPDEHVVQPFFSLEHFETFARKHLQ